MMPTRKLSEFLREPSSWLREQRLGRDYWVFFAAAFFFDAGFALYFFLFNLYLLDQHWNEQAMAWVGGAFTAGSLLGTLPAGVLTRRYGVRSLLLVCFTAAPLLGAVRALWLWPPAAISAALLMGVAMSLWGVCMLPTVAATTSEKNRAQAYSLIFSVSVGTSALGGLLCSALPRWLQQAGVALSAGQLKRDILLGSCLVAFCGVLPILRLSKQREQPQPGHPKEHRSVQGSRRVWTMSSFLKRYLPLMALWSGFLAAFTPFANVYLTRDLHLPLSRVALVFSLVQVIQFSMGLLLPVVLRILGLRNGIAATQGLAALVLATLSVVRAPRIAIVLYLIFAAAQWMSSPALYNLLMNRTEESERGMAAALTMFCSSIAGTLATIIAGTCFTRFGYAPAMFGIACYALSVTVLFRSIAIEQDSAPTASVARPCEGLNGTPANVEESVA